jgi:site-specific recombinase XerD
METMLTTLTKSFVEFAKSGYRVPYREYKEIIREAKVIMGLRDDYAMSLSLTNLEVYKDRIKELSKREREIRLSAINAYFNEEKLGNQLQLDQGGLKVINSSKNLNLQQTGLDQYWVHLSTWASLSTLRGYKSDIKQFLKMITIEVSDITEKEIEQYQRWLLEKYPERNTRVRKLRAVKSLFDFLFTRDFIVSDPFKRIKIGAVSLREQNLLVGALFAFLDAGARKKEIMELRVKDVDLFNEEFHVTLKGGRRASYPIPSGNIFFIRDWLKYRNASSDKLVFYYKGKPLREPIMYNLLYNFQERTIGTIIKPHAFRHHLIDILDEAGASVKEIQSAGNWLSPLTALRYVSRKQNKKTIKKYHPRG